MIWQLVLAVCSPVALLCAYGAFLHGDLIQTLCMAVVSGVGIGSLVCFSLVDASSHNFKELKRLTEELLAENAKLKERLDLTDGQ
jgi:hypothetical protein